MKGNSKISYSALVLDDTSRTNLLHIVKPSIPEDWKIILHHMTICLGDLKSTFPDLIDDIGKDFKLKITHLGVSKKALAFKVDGYKSINKIKHITIVIKVIDVSIIF